MDEGTNALEQSALLSLDFSICCFIAAVSSLCAIHSSRQQQKFPQCGLSAHVFQVNELKLLKRMQTLCQYPCRDDNADANIVACADVGHSQDGGIFVFLLG